MLCYWWTDWTSHCCSMIGWLMVM